MNNGLQAFLVRLEEGGRPTPVQKDKDGVEFIEIDGVGLRKYQSDLLHLIQFECIGYVVIKLYGSKAVARLCPVSKD